MRKTLIAVPAVLAAAGVTLITPAPGAHADPPAAGQQCVDWHATATDASGRALTCTHTADSGHLMYWEVGGAQDTAWVVTR